MTFYIEFSNQFPAEPPPADRSLAPRNSPKPGGPPQPVAAPENRAAAGAHSSALGKTGGAK